MDCTALELYQELAPHVKPPWHCAMTLHMIQRRLASGQLDQSNHYEFTSVAASLSTISDALNSVGWCSVTLWVGESAHCFALISTADNKHQRPHYTLRETPDQEVYILHSYNLTHGLRIERFSLRMLLPLCSPVLDLSKQWNGLWGTYYDSVHGGFGMEVNVFAAPPGTGQTPANIRRQV